MSPLSPTTVTRLDPRYPLLWRDSDTIQFGLENIVHVDATHRWVEPLLARLASGIRLSTFDVVAHAVGAPRQAARDLLARLRPVLRDDPSAAPAFWVEGVNVADDRALPRMIECLGEEGLNRGIRDDPDDVGVIVVEGAASALQFASYLRDDVPHLPVAFEAAAATVGPLVRPGETPCLSCRDEHETRRDPAWPRLHTQLIGRPVGTISSARLAQAAALVARVLRTPVTEAGLRARVNPDGRIAWHSVRFHEGCLCRDLSCRSLPGTGTAPAPLVLRSAPTTARAYARPA